jgi:lipopolysaccharide heptosyltransferase II
MEELISRILVIKLRAIGDVVLSTAVLPNLRNAYPNAKIHFLTEKSCRPVLEDNPYVDRVLTLPADPWTRPVTRASWTAFAGFMKNFRKPLYDMVLDLFGNPRSAWLTRFSGAPIRVGYRFRGREYAYNTKVLPRGDRVHEVEFNLDALRALGIPVVDSRPFFAFSKKNADRIDSWLRDAGFNGRSLIALHSWGSWPAKRWGGDRFAALADRLVQMYHALVVLPWGPGEKIHAEAVQRSAREKTVLAPDLSLKELGALFSRCRLVVANDSGPMHIAAAVGTPTIGIFGPTSWRLQGPYGSGNAAVFKSGLKCLGCNKLECSDLKCMETLGVGDVLKAVENVLGRKRPSGRQE